MKTAPANIDIVKLIYSDMAGWKKAGVTEAVAKRQMEGLAERLINYFALHYQAPAQGSFTSILANPYAAKSDG